MRTFLLAACLVFAAATSANALGTCSTDEDCPSSACAISFCNDGTCSIPSPANKGKVCRAAAGPCDVAEVCTGASTVCPANVFLPSTTVCRGNAGSCDVAEFCTGSSAQCPSDTVLAKGTVCNPSKGVCDVAEVCDGVRGTCPANSFQPATTVCRPAAGPCDVADHCTGSAAACPADEMIPSGTTCRAAAGACDVAEACDGAHAACPADALKLAGTVCRPAANDCDLPEACTGASKDCGTDSNVPSGSACESASACISGGACSGPVCIGGKPELTFSPDPAEVADAQHDLDIAIKHTGSGAPITLTGAAIDQAGTFSIATGPQFPVDLPAGSEVHLTVRLAANATPGAHTATLNVQATSCADQPVQLHATVASPSPDGGTGGGADGGTSIDSIHASGGGCSSGGAPTAVLALVALAIAASRRRRA